MPSPKSKAPRDSSIELYRIIVMLVIILHHYVVNSPIVGKALSTAGGAMGNKMALLMLGAWGKVGINCFVLITGYFMCTGHVSWRKFAKLYWTVVFYRMVCGVAFAVAGYVNLSICDFLLFFIPFRVIGSDFIAGYLIFFFAIPFLNVLIGNLTKFQHQLLLVYCIGWFSIVPTIPYFNIKLDYVEWFVILYFVGAYIRKYPAEIINRRWLWTGASLLFLALGCLSVWWMYDAQWIPKAFKLSRYYIVYYWVIDCHKLPALMTAVCIFLSFKNVQMGTSKFINGLAACTFGVFCLHANSNAMRKWLWTDLFENGAWVFAPYSIPRAIGVVLLVFFCCAAIDFFRRECLERFAIAVATRLWKCGRTFNKP